MLTGMNGEDLIRLVNFDFVKKHYLWCISFHQINKHKVLDKKFSLHIFHLLMDVSWYQRTRKHTFVILHDQNQNIWIAKRTVTLILCLLRHVLIVCIIACSGFNDHRLMKCISLQSSDHYCNIPHRRVREW